MVMMCCLEQAQDGSPAEGSPQKDATRKNTEPLVYGVCWEQPCLPTLKLCCWAETTGRKMHFSTATETIRFWFSTLFFASGSCDLWISMLPLFCCHFLIKINICHPLADRWSIVSYLCSVWYPPNASFLFCNLATYVRDFVVGKHIPQQLRFLY